MDASEYLQPDFDPASYKVAQLRNVLLQNDVQYPTGAKKSDLVRLFNEHIKPVASKKLKKLKDVVADDSGIEVVEKKKKKKKSTVQDNEDNDKNHLKVEKKRGSRAKSVSPQPTLRERSQSPRKSSRKISRSKTEDVEDLPKKRISKKAIEEVPVLRKEDSTKPHRERSPTRKVSSKSEKREKSPLRKEKLLSRRERSPARKSQEIEDKVAEESFKVKKNSKKDSKLETVDIKTTIEKKIVSEESDLEDSDRDSDIEEVSEIEYKSSQIARVFDAEAEPESSFSNENVFQSPESSPQASKTIPKKRVAEHEPRSPKKTARKTAFSSSPPPEARAKSPVKKSLTISKFEGSSSPSAALAKGAMEHDIFNFGNEPEVKFDDSRKRSPIRASTHNKHDHEDGASKASIPEKTKKTKPEIPDFSKFKVSSQFANTLGINLQPKEEAKAEEKNEKISEEDRELLDDSVQSEGEDALNDSELFDLQKDIEDAKSSILIDAEEAVKQINEIFNEKLNDEDDEDAQAEHEEKKDIEPKQSFSFKPLFSFIQQLLTFFVIVTVIIFGLWYRQERFLIGFCGSEIDQPTFPNTTNPYLMEFEELLQNIKPKCLRCPANAICLPNMQLKCKQDYIVKEPWYKLYGVLPFPDYCVKDQEKENIINEILSKSLELLRTRNANYKCGDGDDLEVGISDEELYEFFFNSKRSTISDEDFNELWVRVLKDIENEPEITFQFKRDNDSGLASDKLSTNEAEEEKKNLPTTIIFRSHSTVKLSIACKFQKEVYEKFKSNKKLISTLISISFGLLYVYFKITGYQRQQSRINEISDIIFAKLQKQTRSSITDPTGLTNRYLSAIQLRDELLSNLNNANKFKLWEQILNKLEKNTNVRSSTKEIHGEIVKVLEWISE